MIHLPAVLSDQLGISRSEARRLINTGAVRHPDRGAVIDFEPLGLEGEMLKVGRTREIVMPQQEESDASA